jgi:superfamily I DNA/RNA helicase
VLAQRATFATPIFTRLLAKGIPVKSYYAETELETIRAQERFAFLKLLLNNEDRVALRWLLGRGHPSWRAKPYARLMRYVRQISTSPWETLEKLAAGNLPIPHTGALVDRFRDIRAELSTLQNANGLDQFIQVWLPDDAETKLFSDTVAKCRQGANTVEELYDALYAAITQPDIPLQVSDVRVMSLHKSKGLNSPYVFIAGCVEGLLPGRPDTQLPAAERAAKIQEDRRLFYVGITRVKALPPNRVGYLALTYARTMSAAEAYRSPIAPAQVVHGVARLQGEPLFWRNGPARARSGIQHSSVRKRLLATH